MAWEEAVWEERCPKEQVPPISSVFRFPRNECPAITWRGSQSLKGANGEPSSSQSTYASVRAISYWRARVTSQALDVCTHLHYFLSHGKKQLPKSSGPLWHREARRSIYHRVPCKDLWETCTKSKPVPDPGPGATHSPVLNSVLWWQLASLLQVEVVSQMALLLGPRTCRTCFIGYVCPRATK